MNIDGYEAKLAPAMKWRNTMPNGTTFTASLFAFIVVLVVIGHSVGQVVSFA